jgi:hypothetical protein
MSMMISLIRNFKVLQENFREWQLDETMLHQKVKGLQKEGRLQEAKELMAVTGEGYAYWMCERDFQLQRLEELSAPRGEEDAILTVVTVGTDGSDTVKTVRSHDTGVHAYAVMNSKIACYSHVGNLLVEKSQKLPAADRIKLLLIAAADFAETNRTSVERCEYLKRTVLNKAAEDNKKLEELQIEGLNLQTATTSTSESAGKHAMTMMLVIEPSEMLERTNSGLSMMRSRDKPPNPYTRVLGGALGEKESLYPHFTLEDAARVCLLEMSENQYADKDQLRAEHRQLSRRALEQWVEDAGIALQIIL